MDWVSTSCFVFSFSSRFAQQRICTIVGLARVMLYTEWSEMPNYEPFGSATRDNPIYFLSPTTLQNSVAEAEAEADGSHHCRGPITSARFSLTPRKQKFSQSERVHFLLPTDWPACTLFGRCDPTDFHFFSSPKLHQDSVESL